VLAVISVVVDVGFCDNCGGSGSRVICGVIVVPLFVAVGAAPNARAFDNKHDVLNTTTGMAQHT